jgi:acyl-homoserine lactone acylase PvdQ
MKKYLFFLLLPFLSIAQTPTSPEVTNWENRAKQVTVTEDNWGIPHIYGKKDADAVFGLMYVQCQQNFAQVEKNYLEIMGRLSEIEGERRLYDDLQMRLIYDSAAAKTDYIKSPQWFKNLLDAFSDGVNFYLYKHPETKPLALKRFEPWFPLMYTDGSIAPTQTGGLNLQDLRNFYEGKDEATSFIKPEFSVTNFNPGGSNGFAIAPSRTASKNAILYINPHVTFYFRTEVHLVSEEGLNAYGAVTWGQFFIYQGFNETCGWMHTSSYADVADVYEEKVEKVADNYRYTYDGDKARIVTKRNISINYKNGNSIEQKTFPAYFTHHGAVMGKRGGKWLSLKENNRSLPALLQSWLRTKANGFTAFKKVMDMRSNNSNNTVFADNKGSIAYWHGNFMPRRNPKYDWTLPVDGTNADTEWKGLHALDEIIHLYNPASGWIQNCNSTPFTASGSSSPDRTRYPAYMAPEGENGRAVNAVRLLSKATNITLDKIIEIGYNTYLSAFDILLPPLIKAYNDLPQNDPVKVELGHPIHLLQAWDKSASAASVATTLAVEWASKLAAKIPPAKTPEAATNAIGNFNAMAETITPKEKLDLLMETIRDLEKLYGGWNIAWGDLNRYQRKNNNKFSDAEWSLPVGLGPGTWGSLPSFISRRYDTKKRYGVSGNSFVAAVEFGKRLKAKTIMTGGESFLPSSKHFTDQAVGYIEGKFKNINFYKDDVLKKAQRTYHPGE